MLSFILIFLSGHFSMPFCTKIIFRFVSLIQATGQGPLVNVLGSDRVLVLEESHLFIYIYVYYEKLSP